MVNHCKYDNILSIHVKDIDHWSKIIVFLAPFVNEFTNLLTITMSYPLWKVKLYHHHPINISQNIQKTVLDVVALSGIVYLAAAEAKKTQNISNGAVVGILYVIFAYAIPNIFMNELLKLTPRHNGIKFIIGLIFIYILELTIICLTCIFKDRVTGHNTKEEHDDKKSGRSTSLVNRSKGGGGQQHRDNFINLSDSELILLLIFVLFIILWLTGILHI